MPSTFTTRSARRRMIMAGVTACMIALTACGSSDDATPSSAATTPAVGSSAAATAESSSAASSAASSEASSSEAASSSASSAAESSAAAADLGLMTDGKLVVGMNLQFKPQMYLDDAGKPAGYDVDLLNLLAKDLGVKLDIQNLDFNGLIPGLQSKKFDMVSVGLTATDERKKVIDFSREYVPYTSVLAVKQDDKLGARDRQLQQGRDDRSPRCRAPAASS